MASALDPPYRARNAVQEDHGGLCARKQHQEPGPALAVRARVPKALELEEKDHKRGRDVAGHVRLQDEEVAGLAEHQLSSKAGSSAQSVYDRGNRQQ